MKVQLTAPHTHAGIVYQANDVIEVSEPEYRWLAAHQKLVPGNKGSKPKADAAAAPSTSAKD